MPISVFLWSRRMTMTKEKLLEYSDLQKEIKDLEHRIKVIEKQSEMVGDVVQNGVNGRAIIYGVDIKRKVKLNKLKNKLNNFNDKIIDCKIEIEEFIEKIPSSKTRKIFRYRYFDNLAWFQIAHIMGYNDENAPRKNHDRFLEKNL